MIDAAEHLQLELNHPSGRSVEVVISDAGQKILSIALPSYTKAIRKHLLQRLTLEEAETLLALCSKISKE